MSVDSLKSSVTEFCEKKNELVKEIKSYDSEQAKLDSLSAVSSHLDTPIVSAIEGVQDEFSVERDNFEQQADNIQREKDILAKIINDEQTKIDSVQKKINGLSSKKYSGGLDAVSQKCDLLLYELNEMLRDLDPNGSTGLGDGIGADYPGNNIEKRRETNTSGSGESFFFKTVSKKPISTEWT